MTECRARIFTLAVAALLAATASIAAPPLGSRRSTASAVPGAIARRSTASAVLNAASEPPLRALPFDHILRFAELTSLLESWAAARPGLVQLESLGKTPEGREMWFLTLTNRATGPALDKPGIVVDGNMHAAEWGGGVAALHFVQRLLRDYGTDRRVTELLDTRVVYVLPRMSPDGVEATLTEGRFIRSVDRPYPDKDPAPGIHARDVDGDGRSVFMRVRDPNGPWKADPRDPRLMVPRQPDEIGGDYWRVLPEGTVVGYNGATIADPPPFEPLDFGSNFPADMRDASFVSAGPYPTSEPEVAAYIKAMASRPNIVAHVSCHTFGGLVIYPPVNLDERLPASDKLTFAALAAKAASLTGYAAMSYLDLRAVDRESYIPNGFGWLYNRRGIYSFTTEFWNPLRAAGISLEGTNASAWLWGFHPVEDELKLLKWNDEQLGGQGFVRWHAFNHPQLGPVEIGGWDLVRYWYNIPFDRLEKEVAPHTEWLIYLGLVTPRLAVRSLTAEPVAAGMWRVQLVVENTGWLPTNGSQEALDRRAVGAGIAEIGLPAGARLVAGAQSVSFGQLEGRTGQRSTATWWGYVPGTPDQALVEWTVAAPAGATLSVTVRHERAGAARAELRLQGEKK